ncbi:glycosyltransferase [Vreelandella profundi]|uniref:glycosyltransferase n=1 Tax=Vreelandella profundi TaxID=2852117 RepID=UPI001F2C913F|nr:glycosyltransferase [Halomonas profundi]
MRIAHRGGVGFYPENSLSAIEYSLKSGFDAIQIDVRLTKDLKVVAYHAPMLNAEFTRNKACSFDYDPLAVADLTYSKLLDFEIGVKRTSSDYALNYKRQKNINNEKIPLLENILRLMKRLSENAVIFINLQSSEKMNHFESEVCKRVIEICEEEDFLHRSIFSSFDWWLLSQVKSVCPVAQVWPIIYKVKEIKSLDDFTANEIFAGLDPKKYNFDFKKMINELGFDGLLYNKADREFINSIVSSDNEIEFASWGWVNIPKKYRHCCGDFVENVNDPYFARDPLNSSNIPLSLILTSYNVEEYIDEALLSVINQSVTFGDFEIILVDDGSGDDTVKLASSRLSAWKHKKIIMQSNSGAGGARNTGLLAAKGQYVCFLDGDDYFEPGSLEALYAEIVSSQSNVVLSNRKKFYEKRNTFKIDYDKNAYFQGTEFDIAKIKARIPIHGKIFDKQFLIDNKIFFPEKMSVEDFVFHYELLAKVKKFSIISDVTYAWRKRGGGNTSLTQDRLSDSSLNSRFRQIELTQSLVFNYNFKNKIPGVNHHRTDYQYRLMRHILPLGDIKSELQEKAFLKICDFIAKNKKVILQCIKNDVRPIYEAFFEYDKNKASIEIKRYVDNI